MTVMNSRGKRRLSLILKAGTALPLLLGSGLHAQDIVLTDPGDILVNEENASGTPIAIAVESTGGSVDMTVGTVTAMGAEGDREDVVYVGAAESINADIGSITANGGILRAALFETNQGNIDVTVGAISIDGTATAGVHATSYSGDVTLAASDVVAAGTGIDPYYEVFPEAVLVYSDLGSATAIVGNAETYGQFGSAVVAIAGTTASIDVDTALATSDGAVTLVARGNEAAVITAGTVTMSGDGTAIEGFSSGGSVAINAGNVTSGGLGINLSAATDGEIIVDNIAANRGIYAVAGTASDLSITVNGVLEAEANYAINASGGFVSVNAGPLSQISSGGTGILVNAESSASVTANDIVSSGKSISVGTTAGPVDVTVTGDLESLYSNAISLSGNGVTLSIAEDSIVTGHAGNATVAVGGRDGDIVIDNAGEILALDAAASGIGVSTTTGNISIASASVVVTTASEPVSMFTAAGISADTTGGNIAIEAESVIVDAPSRNGISTTATGDGTISIAAGTVEISGDDRVGLRAQTENGDINITGDTVATSGVAGVGAYGYSVTGDVTIAIGSLTTTGDGIINGHASEGVFAESNSGFASATVGTADITGFGASGAIAIGGAGAAVVAETVTVAGQYAAALYSLSYNGDASIDAGTVILNGDLQSAANVLAYGGNGTLAIDAVVGNGTNGNGAYLEALGDGLVQTGSIDVQDYGITARSQTDGNIEIFTSGDTLADQRWAIRGIGGNVSVETGTGTLTQGGTRGIWVEASQTATVLNGGTVTAGDDLGSAILVSAPGAISITSDTVLVTGAGAFPGLREGEDMRIDQGGIIVAGGAGPVDIVSGSVTVEGEHRYGISVRADGPITIDAGTTSVASTDTVAIVARGTSGDVSITAGTTVTTGASGVGIFGETTSGNITIVADETLTENPGIGAYATGDAIVAISQSGNIAIDSNTAISAGEAGSAIYAYSGTGDVSIVSDYAAATGDAGLVIAGISASGDVSVNAQTVEAATPLTHLVLAIAYDGDAAAVLGDVTGGYADYAAVRVDGTGSAMAEVTGTLTSESDLALSAVGDFGGSYVTVNNVHATSGTGVYAGSYTSAAVTVTGEVDTYRNGIVASAGESTMVVIEGSVTSGGEGVEAKGVYAAGENVQVAVADGASVAGTLYGIEVYADTGRGSPVVSNFGTIANTDVGIDGAALYVRGYHATLINDGVISSATGVALRSLATSTNVVLTENSQIDGVLIAADAGYDTINLEFGDIASTNLGQVAASEGFELLNARSGYWVANTGNSTYDLIDVDAGAALEVRQVGGFASVIAPVIQMDGDLVLNFDTDTEAGDFTGLQIDGAGGLYLYGEATVLFDDTSGLDYTGGTFVTNGTLVLTDAFASDITTSGEGVLQLGDGGATGAILGDVINDGAFVYAREDDFTFLGDFSGTGTLDKFGNGQLLFSGDYAFDGLTTIYGGSIALTGTLAEDTELSISGGVFDLSQVAGGTQTIASLSGAGGTLILGGISLTVNQTGTTVYSGDITGSGEFIIDGTGDLKLEGDISFAGDAIVNGGTLSVNGSMTGADFYINEGGTLGGNGSVGDVTVDGGTVGAGNSIGALTVVGDLTLTSDSIFEIEVNAAGDADLVDVTGTATLGGATAVILAEEGNYAPLTEYTVLTAATLSGEFGEATTNFAYLTPEFTYSASDVTLILRRNDIAFGDYGSTPNQSAIGDLIEDLGYGNPLFDEALLLGQDNVAGAFESLSGEAYPAFSGAMVETADVLRRQMRPAMVAADGAFGWGNGLLGSVSGNASGYRSAQIESEGFAGGLGYKAGDLVASIGVGKLWQDADRLGVGDAHTTVLAATVDFGNMTGLAATVGLQMGWAAGDVARTTTIGTLSEDLRGVVDSDFTQIHGEWAYAFGGDEFSVGPFAGVSYIDLDIDDVVEQGGATALSIEGLDRQVTFGRLGAKARGTVGKTLSFDIHAGWRKAWGDRLGTARIAFAGNGQTASIAALPIARDAAEIGAQIGFKAGAANISLGYDGTLSRVFDSHGAHVGISLSF